MKSAKTIHEVFKRIIPSAQVIKLFKFIDGLKIIESLKIIGVAIFILFIFFINLTTASTRPIIPIKKLPSHEAISFLPRFWLAELASAKPTNFKLIVLDRPLPYFFKVDLLKIKEKKEEMMNWTRWESARVFELAKEKGGSLFFRAEGKEKIFKATKDSNGEKQETQKSKAQDEETIKPEFKNIKEKISVYAFLAWLWLVIGVLLYILNEQIKEAERRRQLGL